MFIKRIFTAAATVAILITMAAQASAAEVTTSNDAKGETTSRAGTQAGEVDHMAGEPNDGNVEGDGVKTVLRAYHIPQFYADGSPVLDDEGKQVTKIDWRRVPIGDGVEQAEIVHG